MIEYYIHWKKKKKKKNLLISWSIITRYVFSIDWHCRDMLLAPKPKVYREISPMSPIQ